MNVEALERKISESAKFLVEVGLYPSEEKAEHSLRESWRRIKKEEEEKIK